MKRIILLFILSVGVLSMNAESPYKHFSWGVKAGLNLSGLRVDEYKIKVGWQAGLAAEYRLSHRFALASELVFSSEGWSKDFRLILDYNSGQRGKTSFYKFLYYINVPVFAKFYVSDEFSFDLGPQIGFNIPLSISGSGQNTCQFGLGLGGTYNFRRVFLQARYNLGLVNACKDMSGKGYNIQIAVGYKFR